RIDDARRERRAPAATQAEQDAFAARAQDPAPGPELSLLERERTEQVRTAMAGLTPRQHEYLLLRAEGMKLREIAKLYGVAIQSVAESCARAIERLGRGRHG